MIFEKIEQDFIDRTVKLLDQYKDLIRGEMTDDKVRKIREDDQYEVTLLLNCLLGLLSYPHQLIALNFPKAENRKQPWKQQHRNEWLSKDTIETVGDDWGLKLEFVRCPGFERDGTRIVDAKDLTIRNLIRQMRNCAAHASFSAHEGGSRSNKLRVVRFQERDENTTKVREHGFDLEIPVENLDKFVRKFADSALQKLSPKPKS